MRIVAQYILHTWSLPHKWYNSFILSFLCMTNYVPKVPALFLYRALRVPCVGCRPSRNLIAVRCHFTI